MELTITLSPKLADALRAAFGNDTAAHRDYIQMLIEGSATEIVAFLEDTESYGEACSIACDTTAGCECCGG
jgi:hypothetical protein